MIASVRWQFYLYDLEHDPGESKNLAAEQPERVQQLATEFQSWHADTKHQNDTVK